MKQRTEPSFVYRGIEYRAYDHIYAVSRCGKALRGRKPYKPYERPDGYLCLGRRRLMHRVIAIVWIGSPGGAKHVHHINGIKSDNRADNLEWVTPKEHFADRHSGRKHRPRTEEFKQRMRELHLGKRLTEEHKQKIREGMIRSGWIPPGRPRGTKLSADVIQKCRTNSGKNTACVVLGVAYPSYSEAARALGLPPMTVRNRCVSKNYPEYLKGSE